MEPKKDGSPRSVRSVELIHITLRQALNAAVEWKLLEENPAILRYTWKPKRLKKKITSEAQRSPVILSVQQIHVFLGLAVDDDFFPLFVLAIFGGLRSGEILPIRWGDIDFETGQITINKSQQRLKREGNIEKPRTKSRSSNRTIVVGPWVLSVLEHHRAKQVSIIELMGTAYKNEDRVFCRPDGEKWDPKTAYDHFKKLAAKAGFPKHTTLHHLLHNYVTHRREMGHSLESVSGDVGHASTGITRVYDHKTFERKKKEALELESIIEQNHILYQAFEHEQLKLFP